MDASSRTRASSAASNASAMLRRPNILERNLNKTKGSEVSLAAYAFLYSEMLQYSQKKVSGIQDLEKV